MIVGRQFLEQDWIRLNDDVILVLLNMPNVNEMDYSFVPNCRGVE